MTDQNASRRPQLPIYSSDPEVLRSSLTYQMSVLRLQGRHQAAHDLLIAALACAQHQTATASKETH